MSDARLLFENLRPPLDNLLLDGLARLGFRTMTPVQAATIPLFLNYRDVLVEAVTGSGKTLAFVLPLLQMLLHREAPLKKGQVGAVVLSPTRELAAQTHQVIKHFVDVINGTAPESEGGASGERRATLREVLLTGGTDVNEELDDLQRNGAEILVGTPGRLLDILGRDVLDVKGLEVLVLDEADTLLDMGFSAAVSDILRKLPRQRRTGLFSATQTREVKALAKAGMRNPAGIRVSVESSQGDEKQKADTLLERSVPLGLTSLYYTVRAPDKIGVLSSFLRMHPGAKVLVFMLTCAAVDFFTRMLRKLSGTRDLTIEGLHGRMPQKKRTLVFQKFSMPQPCVLVCTDVAARGLDVPDVDWIVQFDPPQDPSFFIHRVGRTARAGRTGNALTLILEEEEAYVDFLKLKGVPMREAAMGEVASIDEDVLPELRELQKADRDLLELGTRAFISYLRAYKEHQCSYIFQFSSLPLGDVATAFALFKLPNIGELREKKIQGFAPDDSVDTTMIPYVDPVREKARQKRLRAAAKEKERRQEYNKANPKRRKKEHIVTDAAKRKRKGKHQRIVEEWDELAKEVRLYKRMKKGKISEEEYERLLEEDNTGKKS